MNRSWSHAMKKRGLEPSYTLKAKSSGVLWMNKKFWSWSSVIFAMAPQPWFWRAVCLSLIKNMWLFRPTMLTGRATIDQELKIRTVEENLILLPEKKTIVSACTTNVRLYVCLFISRNHLLQQCPILDFLLGIVMENAFFTCLFLESIKY